MTTLRLEQTAEVDLASAIDGDDFEVRRLCHGGDRLFLLLAFRTGKGSMACALVAAKRSTLEIEASRVLPYIKHDNGGGTLCCTPSGSRVAVGMEFGVQVFTHRGDTFTSTHHLDAEQHSEEGWFWGDDHVLHFDEMSAQGLVLTDLHGEDTRVLPLEAADRYGLSPAAPLGAFIADDELVIVSLPELAILGRHPLTNARRREELLFHPREPAVFTVHQDSLMRIDVNGGTIRTQALAARPTGRLAFFDGLGRTAFATTGYYALPKTPPTLEVWDAAADRLQEVRLPVDGRAVWMLRDDTIAVAHREQEPRGSVRLSFLRAGD